MIITFSDIPGVLPEKESEMVTAGRVYTVGSLDSQTGHPNSGQ